MSCTGCRAPEWNAEKNVLIFQPGNTYARGLTKTLTADFTPEFSPTIALKGIDQIKAKKHGRREGNRTDEHLSRWANEGVTPKQRDPKFDYICQVIQNQRWLPIAAQFPVGCEELRLATKIDLIVQDLQGRIILIELKCGFDDYFDIENQGNMKYPFETIPASFHNKSFLQLMLTEYLFKHCQHNLAPVKKFLGSYLLHVFEQTDGTIHHTLEMLPSSWCIDLWSDACLTVLRESKFQNRNDRKRIMANGAKRRRYNYSSQK